MTLQCVVVVWSEKLTSELSALTLEFTQSPNYRFAKLVTDHNTLILRRGSRFPLAPCSQMSCLPSQAVWCAAVWPCVCLWPPVHCERLGLWYTVCTKKPPHCVFIYKRYQDPCYLFCAWQACLSTVSMMLTQINSL